MAIYTNFNQINEYMKIGSAKDSCWVCAKKMGVQNSRDAYETLRSLEGKVENQKVVVIRRSGIDTCICMDCIKTIYDEHISPTIVQEVVEESKDVSDNIDTNETAINDSDENNTNTNNELIADNTDKKGKAKGKK